MPLPEGYLPREGDVLSVDVKVKHDVKPGDPYIFTRAVDSYTDVALHAKNSGGASLKRRFWRESEGVIHRNVDRWFGSVVASHGDHVVVALEPDADRRHCPGGLRIFHCNELLPWPGAKPAADESPEPPAKPERPQPLPNPQAKIGLEPIHADIMDNPGLRPGTEKIDDDRP